MKHINQKRARDKALEYGRLRVQVEQLKAKLAAANTANATSRNLLSLCHGNYEQLQAELEELRADREMTKRSFVAATKRVCEIYFTIAADAIGPDEVRKQRGLALKGGEK